MAIDILTLAAAKATAGGGGGSTSKYNQPDWGADMAIVDILPEATYEPTEDAGGIAVIMSALPYSLVDGNTYEVNYNGTSYNCNCRFAETGYKSGTFILGNGKAAGYEDFPSTDEPFVIGIYDDVTAAESGFYGMIAPLDGSSTFTVSIKGVSGEIHKIPNDYTDMTPLIGRVTQEDTTLKLDVSYEDIINAIEAGKNVYLRFGIETYTLASYGIEVVFTYVIGISPTYLDVKYLQVKQNNDLDSGTTKISVY